MKVSKRILSVLLSLCILAGICAVPSTAFAADNASYLVQGEVTGDTFVVHVYLRGTLAYGGRLALSYDRNVLEITSSSSFSAAVKSGQETTVTTEGHADSVLIGKGHAMFAWYSSKFTGVNARTKDKEIAQITFNFVNGASDADFTRNTLGLYYVNKTMVDGWDCSAEIISNTNGALTAYRNTSVTDEYMCNVDYDYPNSDYIPPVYYNISVNVKNSAGEPISSAVMLDNITGSTDTDGNTLFSMPNGVYFYRVTSAGYETKSGYYIVNGADGEMNVTLRSNAELARDIAQALKIGYADGDDASGITTDIVLPTQDEYAEITWSSSDPAISEYGNVIRGMYDNEVTLTATVTVDGAVAMRTFNVTVKSRYTAEQRNAIIVAADKNALEIGYAPGDSADSVTVALTLPAQGVNGSTIAWMSGNEEIIGSDGSVVRPDTSTAVILTAYIIRGTVTERKQFVVVVKGLERPVVVTPTKRPAPTETPLQPTEEPVIIVEPEPTEEPVIVDPEPTEEPIVTDDPEPTEEPVIDDPEPTEEPVIDDPEPTEEPVIIIEPDPTPEPTEEPEATLPPEEEMPEYIEYSDRELVALVTEALEIGYGKGESAENVKTALTLPVIGAEDTEIEWTSSNPIVITPYGGVVRQAEDTAVTLTAKITRGSISSTKTFALTVKAADEIPENPNNGQEAEIRTKNSRRRGTSSGETGGAGNGAEQTAENGDAADKTTAAAGSVKQFADIDTVPWAQTAINELTRMGVINGTSDTTYSPHDNIRRGDYVILLMKLFELDSDITDTFEDVTGDAYYYNEISKAKSLGIIAGIDDTHFAPESHISRQDMMTMTYRALVKLNLTGNMPNSSIASFADADTVSDYATDSLRHLFGGGYIHGDDTGRLNPFSPATRAETAVFLYGLLDLR